VVSRIENFFFLNQYFRETCRLSRTVTLPFSHEERISTRTMEQNWLDRAQNLSLFPHFSKTLSLGSASHLTGTFLTRGKPLVSERESHDQNYDRNHKILKAKLVDNEGTSPIKFWENFSWFYTDSKMCNLYIVCSVWKGRKPQHLRFATSISVFVTEEFKTVPEAISVLSFYSTAMYVCCVKMLLEIFEIN
jgi:hypothetical protein